MYECDEMNTVAFDSQTENDLLEWLPWFRPKKWVIPQQDSSRHFLIAVLRVVKTFKVTFSPSCLRQSACFFILKSFLKINKFLYKS